MIRRTLAAAVLSALPLAQAAAMTDAELKAVVEQRIAGDRSGACIAAAVIEKNVARAYVCADGSARVDATSAFEIGSVTKTMNATLLAQAILAGKATLDTPLADLLPPEAKVPTWEGRKVLLRHVVTHTSGLPRLPPDFKPPGIDDPYAKLDEAALFASLAKATLASEPGTTFQYSNYATMLLSAALARLAGTDYESLVRRQVFEPLAMTHAYVAQRPDGVRAAQGHWSNGRAASAWNIPGNLAGVGGVRATLDDMVNYVQAQLGLRASSLDEAIALTQVVVPTKAHPQSAMNWMVTPSGKGEILAHGGGTGGFAAFVAFNRERGRGVVLLADAAIEGLGPVALHLFDASAPVPPSAKGATADAALIDALVGEYKLASGLPMALTRRGDALVAQAAGQSAFELKYDSNGDFYPLDFDARLHPQRAADGGYAFTWFQLGDAQPARRVDANKPAAEARELTPEALAAYAGTYPLMPGFALRVFVKVGKLYVQGTGQPEIETAAVGGDVFVIEAVGAELRFERGEGKVVAVTLLQNGQKLRGERK